MTEKQPGYSPTATNGKGALLWGDISDVQGLITSSSLSFSDFSLYVVFRDYSVNYSYERLVDHNYINGFYLGRDNITANMWKSGIRETSAPYGRTVELTDNVWHIIESQRSGTTATIRGNGTISNSGTVSSSATNLAPIGIGMRIDNTVYQYLKNGAIAEVIIASYAIQDVDRQRIEGYLAHKWGLTANLPINHPYKTNAPLVP